MRGSHRDDWRLDDRSDAMPKLTQQLMLLLLAAFAVMAGMSLSRWIDNSSTTLEAATAYPTPRALPAFALVNQDGRDVERADLEGRWHLLFFGFTRCPDVCPLTLNVLAQATGEDATALPVDVVLVSVDPERDPPARLKQYVNGFDSRFTGLTGTREAIEAFAEGVGVAHGKVPLGDEGNYTVDHTAAVFVVDPAARITALFTPPFLADAIRRDVLALQRAYDEDAS